MNLVRSIRRIKHPRRALRALASRSFFWGSRHCVLCGRKFAAFLPFRRGLRDRAPLMGALNVVGGDVEQCECPWCGSIDRERHLLMYLRESGLLEQVRDSQVLHVAPEKRIQQLVLGLQPAVYCRGDLMHAPTIDTRFDLAALPFASDSFDFVIANHVLEHVDNVEESLSELVRVLKRGGTAVLQTPYSPMLSTTFSDPNITSEAARFHAYGQEDHVRLFGSNIVELFASYGLNSLVQTHAELLEKVDDRREGVNVDEPFFRFQKP